MGLSPITAPWERVYALLRECSSAAVAVGIAVVDVGPVMQLEGLYRPSYCFASAVRKYKLLFGPAPTECLTFRFGNLVSAAWANPPRPVAVAGLIHTA